MKVYFVEYEYIYHNVRSRNSKNIVANSFEEAYDKLKISIKSFDKDATLADVLSSSITLDNVLV